MHTRQQLLAMCKSRLYQRQHTYLEQPQTNSDGAALYVCDPQKKTCDNITPTTNPNTRWTCPNNTEYDLNMGNQGPPSDIICCKVGGCSTYIEDELQPSASNEQAVTIALRMLMLAKGLQTHALSD